MRTKFWCLRARPRPRVDSWPGARLAARAAQGRRLRPRGAQEASSLGSNGILQRLRRCTDSSSAWSGDGGTTRTGQAAWARQYRATEGRTSRRSGARDPVPTTRRSSGSRATSTRTAPGVPRTVSPARVTPGFTALKAVSRYSRSLSTAAVRHSPKRRARGRCGSRVHCPVTARPGRPTAPHRAGGLPLPPGAARPDSPGAPLTPTTTLLTASYLSSGSAGSHGKASDGAAVGLLTAF